MSESFDALHRWLGIPPAEQPPHHYRLLGLVPFESDPDVISMAADRQMAFVRTLQTGRHQTAASRLLNELAAAQVCLLNPEKKKAYDAQLRQRLAAVPTGTPAQAKPSQSSSQPVPKGTSVEFTTATTLPAVRKTRRRLHSPRLYQAPLALLGLLLVVILGWQVAQNMGAARPQDRQVAPAPYVRELASRKDHETQRAGPTPVVTPDVEPAPAETPVESPAVVNPVPPRPATAPPAESPQPGEVAPPVETTVAMTDEAAITPAVENEPLPSEPAPTPSPDGRKPVPQGDSVTAARQSVLEVYGKELAQATTAPLKKQLAERLLEDADKYRDDTPGHYALLVEARRLATEAQQPRLYMDIVERFTSHFICDALVTRIDSLLVLAPQIKASAGQEALAELALGLADEAIAADDFGRATQLIEAGLAAANKAASRDTAKELTSRREELAARQALAQKLATAEATLADNPNDAAACLWLGTHLCLEKNDWSAGLPLLARLTDHPLAEMAQADLAAPTAAADRVALADRWWLYSQGGDEQAKAFQKRAVHWYKLAEPELTGLARMRALNRIAESWSGPVAGPQPALAPLTMMEARERQTSWAQWLKTPILKTNKVGMKLALIPPGQFRMGSADETRDAAPGASPQHLVRITRPFYMATTEVTVGQFAAFAQSSGYTPQLTQTIDVPSPNQSGRRGPPGFGRRPPRTTQQTVPLWTQTSYTQAAEHPVVNITWDDAQAFCQWLSKTDQAEYRLPTEAEWEYACRAGTESRFFFGDSADRPDTFVAFAGNSPKGPQRAGAKRANAWSVRDMHGNVAEWCADWFDNYSAETVEDPTGPSGGSRRVVRGGSWTSPAPLASAAREGLDPGAGNESTGFRVVCVIDLPAR